LDDLLKELRHMGLGCHMGVMWLVAAGYADDLILLAPSRTAMQHMLKACDKYAAEFNLQFSTDPVPALSKSKCLYMCGHMAAVYPSPLQLGDHDLPWVEHATHLGHELHQMCNMEYDANIKRAQFIEASVQIGETFGFARPAEVLQAIQTYAGHWYGSMLWDLFGEKAGQLYRSWSTCVKLTWNVPRATHSFLVDNLLAAQFFTVKKQLLSRYVNFLKKLMRSTSPEVTTVANMVARCARSTTGRNLMKIERETNLDPWTTPAWMVREKAQRAEVPPMEGWRVQYLGKLLDARQDLENRCETTDEISSLIDDLCRS
jgi:hypothetical protein